ncbi:MAG: polyprenyl synthetase family protein [Bacteroidota bacterium]
MQPLEFYQKVFLNYLEEKTSYKEPRNLYDPITYILHLGGKRLRPVLVLVSAELFGTQYKKALSAAMAVEVFHNFSLVHDDIMDQAPLRRGKPTVHEKWDVNTGILSGDAMLINSYQFLEAYDGMVLARLFQLFNTTAIEVCEGQQLDIDFESRSDVTVSEYLEMITLKTSVLIAAALKMGGIIAQATIENQNLLYAFGQNLGIAFQLQDDYLDAFGDPKTFGKQVGGDILENKKTFLYLKAMELASVEDRNTLLTLFTGKSETPEEKVRTVKTIFTTSGAKDRILQEVEKYTDMAFKCLNEIKVVEEDKAILYDFGTALLHRSR